MPSCHFCADDISGLSHRCNHCDRYFCSDHRLPEKHRCPYRQSATNLGPEILDAQIGDTPTESEGRQRRERRAAPCDVCSSEEDGENHCSVCGGIYCADHFDREKHDCPTTSASATTSADTQGTAIQNLPAPSRRSLMKSVCGASIGLASASVLFDIGPGKQVDEEKAAAGVVRSIEGVLTSDQAPEANSRDQDPATDGDSAQDDGGGGDVASGGGSDGSSEAIQPEQTEQLIHEKVNEKRTERGLQRLSYDEALEEIAHYHNEDMAENGYFAHDSPSGETVGDRYDMFEYDCRRQTERGYVTSGENLFKTEFSGIQYSDEDIATMTVEGWMDSPGHRENLLQGHWAKEGIDVLIVDGSSIAVYVTQNFC